MRSYWKKTRIFLLTLGALAFAFMIYHIGPEEILQQILTLGFSLLLIFIPYLISYLLDTLGWRAILGNQKEKISFVNLFLVRTAGESVNYITPLAFVGGEPVKAYILRRFEIPLVQGLASVVISKTTMVIAQILFVLIGSFLAVFKIEGSGPLLSSIFLLLLVGMVLIGLFLLAQKKGLFMGALKLLEKIQIRIPFIKKHEEKIHLLDQNISDFYDHDKKGFCYSILFFLLGWFAGAFEVYLVLYFLGIPIDIPTAITIEALASIIKSSAFLIPGALGAQEGGNLLIFTVFGLAASTSLTFSLVRRLRELLLIGGGLAVLAHYEVKVSSPLPIAEDKNKETSVLGLQ